MKEKKITMFCLAMLFSVLMWTMVWAESYSYGDVSGDGTIDANDAAIILQKVLNESYTMPLEEKTNNYSEYADVTCDGEIDAADAAMVLQKVLNADFIMTAEKKEIYVEPIILNMEYANWAYPNIAYWSLAAYSDYTEQNYVVTLYKNGESVGEYTYTLAADALDPTSYPQIVRGYIDFTDEISKDTTGEYTFSVESIGDNVETFGDKIFCNDIYVYSDDMNVYNEYMEIVNASGTAVNISANNTVQIKIASSTSDEWTYTISNDNILTFAGESLCETFTGDKGVFRRGNKLIEGVKINAYNYIPNAPGETTITFSNYGYTDVLEEKVVKLIVDENLNVTISSVTDNTSEVQKLDMEYADWAYPNIAYWSLAAYPDYTEQNYVVTLYKNGESVGEYTYTLAADTLDPTSYPQIVRGYIDFTDEISKDTTGEYTFSVESIGDNVETFGDKIFCNDIYVYSDEEDINDVGVAVNVTANNTVQIKMASSSIPYEWAYTLNNNILNFVSESPYMETFAGDAEGFCQGNEYAGEVKIDVYNYVPNASGEITIKFSNYSYSGEIVSEKEVTLIVDENLNVTISDGTDTDDNTELQKLSVTSAQWLYPNIAYWTLADYPYGAVQNYVVDLYKNGEKVQEYTYSFDKQGGDETMGYVDMTEKMQEDTAGEYTFSVKALGDDVVTSDSSVVLNSDIYIPGDDDGTTNTKSVVSVSSQNTVQIKIFEASLPNVWEYSFDNDIMELSYYNPILLVNELGFDLYTGETLDGGVLGKVYNYVPIKSGETTLTIKYSSWNGSTVYQQTKVKFVVDENLDIVETTQITE